MVEELFDEKQDEKVKDLINSFLKKDAETTSAPPKPESVPPKAADEADADTEEELSEEEKLEQEKQLWDNKYTTISANLLGEFDKDGNYKISHFVMAELLAMPKLLNSNTDGEMDLTSEYKDGTLFSFTVTKPEVFDDGQALTNLVLNEKIENVGGKQEQTLSTIVGSYLYKFTEDFDVKRMLVFNIYNRDDPGLKVRTPTDYIGLKLAYNKAVMEAGTDLFEKLEETYFKKHLQIVNGIKNGALVLSLFNEKRKLVEQLFASNPKGKYRALNDLLNQILQSPIAAEIVGSVEYAEAMNLLNQRYMLTAKKISEIIEQNQKVAELKKLRAEKEAMQLGVYITELMKNGRQHGAVIAGAIVEAKKQEAKKAAEKKAEKAAEKAKGGGGKKGGGKKSDKKKDKKKKKDNKKKILAGGKVIVKKAAPVKKLPPKATALMNLRTNTSPRREAGRMRVGQLGADTAGGARQLERETNMEHSRIL